MFSRLSRLAPQQVAGVVIKRFQSSDAGLAIENRNQILHIRFDRPTKKNAITREMYTKLTQTFKAANSDDSVRALLLTGSGDYYSSGNDLSNFAAAAQHPEGLAAGLAVSKEILIEFVDSLINLEKFLIAAVNGPAVGIPVTTLPLCDYVVASNKATFQTPFTALGQCPEACSSLTFPSILGRTRANELLSLNMTWDAKKAKQYGLISEVIEHDKFDGFVDSLTKQLVATCYPKSMMVSKSVVQNADIRQKLSEANRRECDAILECWLGEECADAVEKFFKRSKK